MTVKAKVKAGFSIGLVAVISLTASLLSEWTSHTRGRDSVIPTAMLALALGSWLIQGVVRNRDRGRDTQRPEAEHPLVFLRRPAYWGALLLLAAGPTYWLIRHQHRPLPVAARPFPSQPRPAVVEFPPLAVSAVVCNGPRSVARINGRTVALGEWCDGVQLTEVDARGVIVERNGVKKRVPLRTN